MPAAHRISHDELDPEAGPLVIREYLNFPFEIPDPPLSVTQDPVESTPPTARQPINSRGR